MIKEKNKQLKMYNTFHINAQAKNFYIPESEEELLELIKNLENEKYYIISGGSNILLRDDIIYDNIIYMKKVDEKKINLLNGKFYFGASNRIQNVINFLNQNEYGGFEELYSLPAFWGGIIYMNAGIGGKNNKVLEISNFIKKVKVINKEKRSIEWMNIDECEFGYRKSIFHNNKYIILGSEIEVEKQEFNISKERIKRRIEFCKIHQEHGNGCFGTCFSKANSKLLKLAKMIKKNSKEIRFGEKNSNWLVNDGNGKYSDAKKLIERCVFLHKILLQKIELEIKIFE